jgi:hypothetical protein
VVAIFGSQPTFLTGKTSPMVAYAPLLCVGPASLCPVSPGLVLDPGDLVSHLSLSLGHTFHECRSWAWMSLPLGLAPAKEGVHGLM